jgi:hypothetical protein
MPSLVRRKQLHLFGREGTKFLIVVNEAPVPDCLSSASISSDSSPTRISDRLLLPFVVGFGAFDRLRVQLFFRLEEFRPNLKAPAL